MRISIFALIIVALACSSKENTSKSNTPSLYVNQITFTEMPSGAVDRKDSLFTFNDQFLDISLKSFGNGKHYQAEKYLTQNQELSVLWSIVDSLKNDLKFNGTTEFLNYMAKRGYEPANQKENKYGADYTFKRK